MIYDSRIEDFDIVVPIKDYIKWLIVEVRNSPPHLAEYILKDNKIYLCDQVTQLPQVNDDVELFKCKLDLQANIFVDPTGQTLEVVREPNNRTFKVSNIQEALEQTNLDTFVSLMWQAIYGLDLISYSSNKLLQSVNIILFLRIKKLLQHFYLKFFCFI